VCSFLKSCVQFLVKCVLFGEAKVRDTYRMHVSHLSKGRRAYKMRISHLSEGRHVLWRRVSLLLNICTKKKKALHIILQRLDAKSTAWSTSCLKSSNQMAYHRFKSQ
jgi:hypothetical protein